MAITIKDIAKFVGVSAVTVSRALNDKPDINKETKSTILKAAKSLGYQPNGLAKSLVTRKTKTIGVLIPDTMDSFFSEIIQGISDECLESGYSLMLSHTQADADKELEYLRMLREKRVEGILIYPVQEDQRYIEEIKKSTIPFVFLNRHTSALECDFVANDNHAGAYLAIEHLIQKGHKKMAYICSKPHSSSGIERIAGCKCAVNAFRLPEDVLTVEVCDSNIESCYLKVRQLLSEKSDITAIFVWDDKLAIGAIKAILEKDLRIPQDIALVGYNDVEISKYLYPPLTTIRQATYKIGKTAARILLERLEAEGKTDFQHIVMKPELIIRGTT